MKPKDKIKISDNHSIEWGEATWTQDEDEKDKSIRNRYDREGGFNYAGSSELLWYDFNLMIIKSIERMHFSQEELEQILNKINLMKELSPIITELDEYRKEEVEKLSENTGADAQSIMQKIAAVKEGFKDSVKNLETNPIYKSSIIKNYSEDLKKMKSEIDFLLNIKIR